MRHERPLLPASRNPVCGPGATATRLGRLPTRGNAASSRHAHRRRGPGTRAKRHPQADFAAINQAPVFRILEEPFDPVAISRHLREAMGLSARQRLASLQCEDGGPALRDALAFLAHEINTPQIEHDFALPLKAGLLHLVFFTLMRMALNALRGMAQPRLRITLCVHEGISCIRFSHNGKRPPAQALSALTAHRVWRLEGQAWAWCSASA